MNLVAGIGICAFLALIAFKKNILSPKGVVASFLIGLIVSVLGGLKWLTILLTFVITGFISTKVGFYEKKKKGILEGENGERKIQNVLANGVIPIGIVMVYWLSLSLKPVSNEILPILTAAYVGSLSTATSDTLASEIGSLDNNTRLITNLKKVKPGSDGGISLLGELASILGALIIATVSYFLFSQNGILLIALISGIIGCHTDSLLGATLERKNYLNNEGVNLIATSTGALIGGIFILA